MATPPFNKALQERHLMMHVDLNEEGIYMMGADGSLPTHGQGSPKSCNQSLQTPRNVLLREMRGRMDGFALPGHYSKAKQGRVVRQMEKRFFVKLVFELLHAFKKASQTLCCSFAPAPGTCCLLLPVAAAAAAVAGALLLVVVAAAAARTCCDSRPGLCCQKSPSCFFH